MCSRDGRTHKIVASTATIRRAQQQCKDLYAREAFEFPPQAVRAGESYFAFEDQQSPGRLYVGFMGTAVKSHQTALVRACSPLLQGVCVPTSDDEVAKRDIIDPYGTMVWYFNSLRELGHAATLCMGDIPEFLKGLRHRLGIPFENSRYLREIVELTSRLSAEEIPGILQQLEIPWQMKPSGQPPVDILLATNMIAVGVDVPRLGLDRRFRTTQGYIGIHPGYEPRGASTPRTRPHRLHANEEQGPIPLRTLRRLSPEPLSPCRTDERHAVFAAGARPRHAGRSDRACQADRRRHDAGRRQAARRANARADRHDRGKSTRRWTQTKPMRPKRSSRTG